MTYVGAFLWGFALLGSFYGHGMIVGRVLGRRFVDGGLAIAWGLALLIVVGGLLNLAGVISPIVVVSLVLAGQVAWLVLGGPRRLLRAARRLRTWDYLTLAVLLVAYVNWLCFNGRTGVHYTIYVIDDSAYTLFPELMLHTGSMGVDPFDYHLTLAGLGGQAFLQALILAVCPLEYIHLADPGLAFPAIGVMLFSGWPRRLTAPARAMLAIFFASIPTALINVGPTVVPVVLLLAIVRELEHARTGGPIRSGAGVALLLAALLTLKTTLLPIGILLVFFRGVLLALTTRRVRPLLEGVVTAGLLVVLLLPWMMFSYYSAGTLFYPVLGAGFTEHSEIVMPHRAMDPVKTLRGLVTVVRSPQTLVMLFGLITASVCVLLRKVSEAYRAAHLAGFGASLVCLILFATAFAKGGMHWRYYYPICAFADLIAYSVLLRLVPTKGAWRYPRMAIFLILAGHILFYMPRAIRSSVELPEVIRAAFQGRTRFTTAQIGQYRQLQNSVPAGRPIFSIVDWPLLFDLNRNKFYYHSIFGAISPPPGIPLRGDPKLLADYLRSLGLRYVACPSREVLRVTIATRTEQRNSIDPIADKWMMSQYQTEITFLELIYAMCPRYASLYEDGQFIMIDLESPVAEPATTAATLPASADEHAVTQGFGRCSMVPSRVRRSVVSTGLIRCSSKPASWVCWRSVNWL
jgi:hypothetical protein